MSAVQAVEGAPVRAYHVPVMAEPTVRLMLDAPPGPLVDGTLGGGGHVAALVEALRSSGATREIIGIDQDTEALAAASDRLVGLAGAGNFRTVHGNFRDLAKLLPGVKAAAILLDLGVSSWQLDAAHRGFAIKHPESALDMRMDATRGMSALELVRSFDVPALARVLRDYGEVKDAHRLADRIKEAAEAGKLATTGELARLVEREASGRKLHVHPATLVFQALRIAVNDELGALEEALRVAPEVLVPGGRLLVMSYHSLEDRMVKHTFLEGERGPERPAKLPPPSDWHPTWKVLTRQPITATDAEIASNPRSRSARLRAAQSMRGVVATGGGPR